MPISRRSRRGSTALLDRDVKLDSYTQAHLEESSARIAKVVDAKMSVSP